MQRAVIKCITWLFVGLAGLPLTLMSCQQQSPEMVGPADKIIFAYPNNTSNILVLVALQQGYFAEIGLEVTPQPYPFGKLALNAVIEGKADLATVADTPFMFAVNSGHKIYTIAEIQTSFKHLAVIGRKDRGIARPNDLQGKKIGVTLGTTGDFFIDSFLLVHGLGRNEVQIIDLQPGEMLAALNQGKVEAVSIWNPVWQQLHKALGNKGIVFFEENIYSAIFCLVVKQEFAQKNPRALQKVLRALLKAETFVQQHPEAARQLVAEFLRIDKAIVDEVWDFLSFKVTLDQALLVSLEDQTMWAQKYGLTKSTETPNYLEFIYFEGLQAVRPEAVRIIR